MTTENKDRFLELISEGDTLTWASKALDLNRTAVARELCRDQNFAKGYAAACQAMITFIAAWEQMAVVGTFPIGSVHISQFPRDDKTLSFTVI
jgi:hypothetical protein